MAILSTARRWLRTKVPGISATFADWLSATVRTEFVLCEVEPSKTLTGFVPLGEEPGPVYTVAFPRFHQTDVIEGGLYAKVIGVQENDAALVERTSVADVAANAGSWYWDQSTELLYVHTTSGSDPDTFTLLQANVRLFLSNAPITLRQDDVDPDSAVYYLPWLTNDLPRIKRIREDLLSGAMATPEGRVSFTNTYGAWFTLVAPDGLWNWKNKPIRFYIGGSSGGMMLTRSQFQAMAAMRIDDVAPTETVCTFTLQPLQKFADLQLPVTPFFEGDYPNLGDGVRGTKKWIGYGRAIVPPDLTDTTSYGVYTVADAAYQTLFAVYNVWAIEKATDTWTLLTLTTHYTVDLTACTVTIVSASFPHADYTIAVDVSGKPDGLGSYFRTYAPIVKDILETHLGATSADMDTAAFTLAAADAQNEISCWMKADRSLASILATAEQEFPSLGRSSLGTVQQTVDGKWTTRVWNPDTDAIDTTLRKADLARFEPKPKLKTIYATVRVFYGFDHVRQQWSFVEADDPATRYRTGSRDRLDLYTYLTSSTDAQRLAQRYQLLAGAVTVEAAFTERGALLCQLEGGGKTFVTYDPAPAIAGEYVNQPFETKELDIVMAPKLSVSGVLSNLHGLGGRVGRWMVSTADNWAAASPAVRQNSGFWCDDTGRADPADPESANQSIWW